MKLGKVWLPSMSGWTLVLGLTNPATLGILLLRQWVLPVQRAVVTATIRLFLLPFSTALYALWTANNFTSWLLALCGRPPTHYHTYSQVNNVQRDLEDLRAKDRLQRREIDALRQETQDLRRTRKEFSIELKQAKQQLAEQNRQLQLFRQWTLCNSGEAVAVEFGLVGRLGIAMHTSVLLAALSVWSSLHADTVTSMHRLVIYSLAVLGSWWYIALLLAPARSSRSQMQVVYCISWVLVGFAASEHLRRLASLAPAWALSGLMQGMPSLDVGAAVSALGHQPLAAVGGWLEAGYEALQEWLQPAMVMAADGPVVV